MNALEKDMSVEFLRGEVHALRVAHDHLVTDVSSVMRFHDPHDAQLIEAIRSLYRKRIAYVECLIEEVLDDMEGSE